MQEKRKEEGTNAGVGSDSGINSDAERTSE